MHFLKKITRELSRHRRMAEAVEQMQCALARIELRQMQLLPIRPLRDAELKVFSQFGEDGILQYLLRHVPVPKRVFVEFGVSDYAESNTRFLLQNDNWSGLVIDGSRENVDFIRSQPYYWRHTLKAECAFIDRDNINGLIRAAGVEGDIGILSVDIDGNDYWVLEAIDCIRPAIMVCEYNSLFGAERQLSVPYDPRFSRAAAHYSWLYFGASLPALAALAARRGYALVGSNSAGNNAFFVRRDLLGGLPEVSAAEAWMPAQFREGRGRDGRLSFAGPDDAVRLIADLPVVDCETGQTVTLRSALKPA